MKIQDLIDEIMIELGYILGLEVDRKKYKEIERGIERILKQKLKEKGENDGRNK